MGVEYMDLLFDVETLSSNAVFKLPGYQVWCGSMIQDIEGICHLFFSAWPEHSGFDGWLTASMIAHAMSPSPDGIYEFQSVILSGCGVDGAWDRDVTHNPTVLMKDGVLYLYYTGNYGNGQMWNHRNHQQVGVAYAEKPVGPWHRSKSPIISHPGAVMVSNPTVCEMNDGYFLMIYKWVAGEGEPPFFGPVRHGAAISESPMGPFVTVADDLFGIDGAFFAGEDPFVFRQNGRYFCIVKDNARNYSSYSRALVVFESGDGIHWRLRGPALTRRIADGCGNETEMFRLERPQLSFCSGQTRLFCAVKPREDKTESFSINLRVKSAIFANERVL
jgi:hypothetical protein